MKVNTTYFSDFRNFAIEEPQNAPRLLHTQFVCPLLSLNQTALNILLRIGTSRPSIYQVLMVARSPMSVGLFLVALAQSVSYS